MHNLCDNFKFYYNIRDLKFMTKNNIMKNCMDIQFYTLRKQRCLGIKNYLRICEYRHNTRILKYVLCYFLEVESSLACYIHRLKEILWLYFILWFNNHYYT